MKLPFDLPPVREWPWKKIVLGLAVVVGLVLLYRLVDVDKVHEFTQKLDGWLVFVLLVALPLVGFPVTVMHIVAGMRWGPVLGLTLVVISIFLQLLASYGLVHLFRPHFARKLEPLRKHVPQGAHGPVTLFTLLLPGVPYVLKNYMLPLAGVPLRIYLLWALPIHALRSSVAVIFGNQSDDLTPLKIAGFCAYGLVVTLSCGWAFRRMKTQISDQPLTASDRTQRG